MRPIEEALREPLLFDGAMGTYYAQLYGALSCEAENVAHPERIRAIHEQYLRAGARALKTNTFRVCALDEPDRMAAVDAGYRLACEAAAPFDAWVFADLGPAPTAALRAANEAALDRFLALGARQVLLETFAEIDEPLAYARRVKAACPEAFVLVSIASQPEGYTPHLGLDALECLRALDASPDVDAIGLNCVSGPRHLLALAQRLGATRKPLSVMPNSGYPAQVDGRTVYTSSPAYFAEQMRAIARYARIVGGCCGTTPQHIRACAEALTCGVAEKAAAAGREADARPRLTSRLAERLRAGERVVAVELDAPNGFNASGFVSGAQRLTDAGADAITVADCPIGRVRADSCMLAAKLRRELGVDVLPHMTCRDRNLNAIRALLTGLFIEGIGNLLVVTGDPVPGDLSAEVKSVFNFNAIRLAGYARQMGGDALLLFGALNVNANRFDAELRRAEQKLAAGVNGFLTQPVFTEAALHNLWRARQALPAYLLGGVMPVVSEQNARFLQNEVGGITLDDALVRRFAGLPREAAEALGERVAVETGCAMADFVDGYYLMTPFRRVPLMCRIIEQLRQTPRQRGL